MRAAKKIGERRVIIINDFFRTLVKNSRWSIRNIWFIAIFLGLVYLVARKAMGLIVFLHHFDENIVHAWHNRVEGYHFDVGNYALKQLIAFRWANGHYLRLGN
jgi:hypothetical protein